MDVIIEFIQGIGEAIVTAFDFVVSFFSDIIYVIELTGKFLAMIPVYFSWLPPELLAMLVIIFGVVVIYKILGREG